MNTCNYCGVDSVDTEFDNEVLNPDFPPVILLLIASLQMRFFASFVFAYMYV